MGIEIFLLIFVVIIVSVTAAYGAESGETSFLLGLLGSGTRGSGGDRLGGRSTIESSRTGVVVWHGLRATGSSGSGRGILSFCFLGVGKISLGSSFEVAIGGSQVFFALQSRRVSGKGGKVEKHGGKVENMTYPALAQVGESCQVGDKLIGDGIGVRHGDVWRENASVCLER